MTRRLARLVATFLDVVLGPRCHVCSTRVYPKDTNAHYRACCRSAL